ncbi:hypothetical protein KC19_VG319800 [Ceratodon purpureus]|uniref:Uncharacterized protein n=1 Tax=Ceratodon purpureus TaxID=3225 RepID=A0A8T0HW90_CERPU|nr:hypothetical protein KC19_VG319800 [Ceratodon purpureus]
MRFNALNGSLDGSPHLKELLHSYKSEWIKDGSKYGRTMLAHLLCLTNRSLKARTRIWRQGPGCGRGRA